MKNKYLIFGSTMKTKLINNIFNYLKLTTYSIDMMIKYRHNEITFVVYS